LQYKYIVLTNTTIGAFMVILDANIVLIALPTIIAELPGTDAFFGIWIIMGYILITATLLLTFGRLSDMVGRVKLYNLGFAVFTIGSALCSLAQDGLSLVLFRLVQGAGGALLFSNNAALLTDVFPATERGRALGLNQVAGAAGSVSGLALGGVLAAIPQLGWRSIFWINIPIGIFATAWAYLKLRETSEPRRGERLDPLGNVLFATGLSMVLLGLTLGALLGWSLTLVGATAAGALLLFAFVAVETKVRFPMMDFSLFRIRPFSAGILANLLGSISRGALPLVLVFYFQGVLGLDPLTAGLMLVPFTIAFVTVGPLSGYLSDKYGSRGFATAGLLVGTFALFLLAVLPFPLPYGELAIPMILAGVGGGMFVAPNIASIMNATPPARRGVASGMSSTLVNAGFLLSLAFAFMILGLGVPVSTLQSIFAGQNVEVGRQGTDQFVASMRIVFLLNGGVSLLAAVTASRTKGRTKIEIADPEAPD